MPLTNVDRLMETICESWLIENFPHKLQIPMAWVWRGIEGTRVEFARTNRMSPDDLGEVVEGCEDEIPVNTAQPDTQVAFELATLMTRYQICMADLDRIKYPEHLKQVEYELAKMRLTYRYFQRLGQVTGTTTFFPGLRDIVGTGKTINMTGALTFAAVDQAYHLIESNQGRPNAIMSTSRVLRTFRSLFFGSGAGEPEFVDAVWSDPIRGRVAGKITAFNGTPWYVNDLLDDAAGETGIIYFMVLGDDGTPGHRRGITGLVPKVREHSWFTTRETNGVVAVNADPVTLEVNVPLDIPSTPFVGESSGSGEAQVNLNVSTLPTVDTWVSWPTGVAMGSQGSLSILQGFDQVANLATT
jgi:hypothetical protein